MRVRPAERVHALGAEGEDGGLLGLAHDLFHRSTTRAEGVCLLQDLFTAPEACGSGVGRALIETVCAAAREASVKRVYGQTQATHAAGRALDDKVVEHRGFVVCSHDV